MANIITITSTNNITVAPSFNFDLMNVPAGVPVNLTTSIEALRAKGVDGTIYRETGKQHRPFNVRTVAYFASFNEAKVFARDLELCRNSFIRLDSEAHGIHNNIFCTTINSTPLSGEGAGPNIPVGTKAYVMSSFGMVRA